jgi:peptide chain release factor subunit 1
LEITERVPLVEWLANEYKKFGANIEFVTDRSQEGSQFCKGFGGIGGLLRWRVDFTDLEIAREMDNAGAAAGADSEDEAEEYENYEDSFL